MFEDVEFDTDGVSVGRGSRISHVEGFLDKEFSLLFTSELPTLFEPGIFGFPAVEEAIRGKFRVSFKELIDGCGRSTDYVEDAFSEEMVKPLRSADRPAIVGEVGIGRCTGSEKIVDLLFEEPGRGTGFRFDWRQRWRAL